MLRIRGIGVVLVAVFAVSAVVASSASAALPAFFHCATSATGKYSTKAKCEKGELGGTGFELLEVAAASKITFTSESGEGTLETANGTKVTCKADKDEGVITGPKTVEKVFVKFTGCKESIFNAECKTTGAAGGEIKTNELKGELGYINKAKKEAGLDLKPVGELFVEFNCLGGLVKVKVRGSLIGKASPVNKLEKTGSLIYKQTKGTQEFTKFEGGAEDVLESSKNGEAFEKSGETTTDTITYAEAIEARA